MLRYCAHLKRTASTYVQAIEDQHSRSLGARFKSCVHYNWRQSFTRAVLEEREPSRKTTLRSIGAGLKNRILATKSWLWEEQRSACANLKELWVQNPFPSPKNHTQDHLIVRIYAVMTRAPRLFERCISIGPCIKATTWEPHGVKELDRTVPSQKYAWSPTCDWHNSEDDDGDQSSWGRWSHWITNEFRDCTWQDHSYKAQTSKNQSKVKGACQRRWPEIT